MNIDWHLHVFNQYQVRIKWVQAITRLVFDPAIELHAGKRKAFFEFKFNRQILVQPIDPMPYILTWMITKFPYIELD